jgi:hypothetical protein
MAQGLFQRGPLLMKERHSADFADGAISVCAGFFALTTRPHRQAPARQRMWRMLRQRFRTNADD